MDHFAGKCVGGPYDGKEYASPAKRFAVRWIEGNALKQIPLQREGDYEFFHGIWRWSGPTYRPAHITERA